MTNTPTNTPASDNDKTKYVDRDVNDDRDIPAEPSFENWMDRIRALLKKS